MEQQLRSLHRVALAVARPGSPAMALDLVRELAAALDAAMVFVAIFDDDGRSSLHTLAAQLDDDVLPPFSFTLADTTLAQTTAG